MTVALPRLSGGVIWLVLLLAGVALNAFISAMILFVQYLSDFTQTYRAVRWLIGDLVVGSALPVAASLPLLLLLLGAAWLLRDLLPAPPELALATREATAAPTAPTPPRDDRLPILKASLSSEQARAKALQLELAAAQAEVRKRIADCRPPEPPKVDPPKIDPPRVEAPKPPPNPPQIATAPPPKAPNQTPPPQQQPRNPNDNRLRLPSQPKPLRGPTSS